MCIRDSFGIVDVDRTGDLGHDGHRLRAAALKQFLNAGKTLGAVSYTHLDVYKRQGQKRVRLLKRLECVESFLESNQRPEWMIMTVIHEKLAGLGTRK